MYEMQQLPAKSSDGVREADGPSSEKSEVGGLRDEATWAYVAAGLLFVGCLLFLCFPSFLLFLGSSSTTDPDHIPRLALTQLELFLSTQLGLLLFALSLSLIASQPSDAPITSRTELSPSHHPLLYPLTASSALSSIVSYNSREGVAALGLMVSCGSSIVALWGLSVILFANSARVSKSTGADKHSSSFLFGNTNAASVQKKQWRKEKSKT